MPSNRPAPTTSRMTNANMANGFINPSCNPINKLEPNTVTTKEIWKADFWLDPTSLCSFTRDKNKFTTTLQLDTIVIVISKKVNSPDQEYSVLFAMPMSIDNEVTAMAITTAINHFLKANLAPRRKQNIVAPIVGIQNKTIHILLTYRPKFSREKISDIE